jgi:hypothetical protein
MAGGFPSLVLTPFWHQERILLVGGMDAIRLCSDGRYQALQRQEIVHYWHAVSRLDQGHLRDFLSRSRLASPALANLGQVQLLRYVRDLIKGGVLVMLREGDVDGDGKSSSTVEQRRVVRSIEREGRRLLSYEGRRYKLVAGDDLAKVPNRSNYEVVVRSEATKVLDGLAKQAELSLGKLLEEARGLLSADWRPPLYPDGLVLLKAIIEQASQSPERHSAKGPAAAPIRPPEPDLELDQDCQASTLTNAARDGAPFCQEC